MEQNGGYVSDHDDEYDDSEVPALENEDEEPQLTDEQKEQIVLAQIRAEASAPAPDGSSDTTYATYHVLGVDPGPQNTGTILLRVSVNETKVYVECLGFGVFAPAQTPYRPIEVEERVMSMLRAQILHQIPNFAHVRRFDLVVERQYFSSNGAASVGARLIHIESALRNCFIRFCQQELLSRWQAASDLQQRAQPLVCNTWSVTAKEVSSKHSLTAPGAKYSYEAKKAASLKKFQATPFFEKGASHHVADAYFTAMTCIMKDWEDRTFVLVPPKH